MIADLGTRRGTTLEDTNSGSQWINSFSWMNKEVEYFPMKTVRELSLSSDVNQIKEEILSNKNSMTSTLINKHIQDQSITKAIFQKKLHLGSVCQTTFLIQTNSFSPK